MSDHAPLIGGRFPPFSSRDLEGKTFEIPVDLPGSLNVVVLAFSREHRSAVESWLDEIQLCLVVGSGVIRWHTAGGWTAEKFAGLTAALEVLLP